MTLALLTAAEWPQGDADDQYLLDALQQRGIAAQWQIWQMSEHLPAYDLCLIRSVWDYHLKPQAFLQFIQDYSAHTPVLNPANVVVWNSEKTYLRELQKAGLPVAETHWIDQLPQPDDFVQLLSTVDTEEWFLKPIIGADASGTLRFKADRAGTDSAMNHLQQQLAHSGMMLQPFLPSVADEGELSVIYVGEQLTHAVIKKPQRGDYRVQDTFGGVDCAYDIQADERAVADQCMAYLWRRFGPLCYARLDFLRNLSGQWVINEVELIEPSLFFRHCPQAAQALADYIVQNFHYKQT